MIQEIKSATGLAMRYHRTRTERRAAEESLRKLRKPTPCLPTRSSADVMIVWPRRWSSGTGPSWGALVWWHRRYSGDLFGLASVSVGVAEPALISPRGADCATTWRLPGEAADGMSAQWRIPPLECETCKGSEQQRNRTGNLQHCAGAGQMRYQKVSSR